MKSHHHKKHKINQSQSKAGHPKRHLIRIFLIYLTVAVAVAGWLEYSSYDVFNPSWMLLIALGTAIIATLIHGYTGWHNRIDDIADGDL